MKDALSSVQSKCLLLSLSILIHSPIDIDRSFLAESDLKNDGASVLIIDRI
jgi:hypothetical protein